MTVAGLYSFNDGRSVVESRYPQLLSEIYTSIENVNAESCKSKVSREKTTPGQILFSPIELNKKIKENLLNLGWQSIRVSCDYPTSYYVSGYLPKRLHSGAFREMDFVKQRLGIEVQFGKYSFMVYNVAAKMTIFRNLGYIDAGVEIVPIKALADEMSSGVSYFEQFVWDLQQRGVADIDIPVLIIGIDA